MITQRNISVSVSTVYPCVLKLIVRSKNGVKVGVTTITIIVIFIILLLLKSLLDELKVRLVTFSGKGGPEIELITFELEQEVYPQG